MSATAERIPVTDISMDELQSILEHVKKLGLPEKEYEVLCAVVESHAYLLSVIGDKKATIARLRQLIFGTKTEKKANIKQGAGKTSGTDADEKPKKKKKKKKGHGRIPADAYTGAETVKVPHAHISPGDPCIYDACAGKAYPVAPRKILRIHGFVPFTAIVYEQDRLRCNLCGEVFAAELPPEVGEEKFDETVASMAAILRYGNGFPMNRIEDLQKTMGVPFPASVQWELMRDAAKKIEVVHGEFIRQAAQGKILYNDDTPMKILAFLVEQKKRKERGEKPEERTGTFTSGIVSESSTGRRIVLYFTGRRHAGENLEALLTERATGLDPPIQMCDGLGHNAPREIKTILGNCMAHARRKFVDVVAGFPDEVDHVIDEISLVYKHDAQAKAEGMSAEARLRLHQAESGPVMARLKIWFEERLEKKKAEPNSGLGKAIAYAMKRWEQLTLFLRKPGAPLDNSLTERMLKRSIIHRKNSLFYKTANGAAVGDLYMALIATAKLADANPFDYLNELQRNAKQLADDPAAWMPWNYRETVDRAAAAS